MGTNQFIRNVTIKKEKITAFNEYPFSLNAVRYLKTLNLHPKATFITGENGSGKSTLLEAIAVSFGFNPEGGTKNFNFNTRSSHSILHEYILLTTSAKKPRDGFFLRAESFYNLATNIEQLDEGPGGPPIINSYGKVSLHEQSHGESFFSLFINRFNNDSLFILDEPEAALSPRRQMAFITRMHQLINKNCQFIIATHSPVIMSYPNSYIYILNDKSIKRIKYTNTEHYTDTKDFLNKHEEMLKILMYDE